MVAVAQNNQSDAQIILMNKCLYSSKCHKYHLSILAYITTQPVSGKQMYQIQSFGIVSK